MLETIVSLAVMVGLGLICMGMAGNRGRNRTLGFFMGFLFVIWAVLGYALIGDTPEKKAELMAKAMKKYKDIV